MRFVALASAPTRRSQSARAIPSSALHRDLRVLLAFCWLLPASIAAHLSASPASAAAPDELRSRVDAVVAQHLGQGAVASLAIGIHELGREATFFYGDAGRDLGCD